MKPCQYQEPKGLLGPLHAPSNAYERVPFLSLFCCCVLVSCAGAMASDHSPPSMYTTAYNVTNQSNQQKSHRRREFFLNFLTKMFICGRLFARIYISDVVF